MGKGLESHMVWFGQHPAGGREAVGVYASESHDQTRILERV